MYIYNLSINLCFNHLHSKENTSNGFFSKATRKKYPDLFFL